METQTMADSLPTSSTENVMLSAVPGHTEEQSQDARLRKLAPRPLKLEDCGVPQTYLSELLTRHLLEAGVLPSTQITQRLALASPVVEALLDIMRSESLVEVLSPGPEGHSLRYQLTDRGRAYAMDSQLRDGYVGPAPIPMAHYIKVLSAQSVHQHRLTCGAMHQIFSDIVIDRGLLDQIGAAMQSGRGIFVYGAAGTGKTYIAHRLSRMLGDLILVPHAIFVGDIALQLYDPAIHNPFESQPDGSVLMLDKLFDSRFVLCHRPTVISGGELTLDDLEVQYDSASRQSQAPLHLKASNGIYMIDDLGRQRVSTSELFNRWIVPLEERHDYLTLRSGRRFQVPFDVKLIFSTNLDPGKLADDTFLRRLGHKIRFEGPSRENYTLIWKQVCASNGIPFDQELLRFLFEDLYGKSDKPMLPCHPRDLLGIALDHARYMGSEGDLNQAYLEIAWRNYFGIFGFTEAARTF
jgi:predicted ATPase with chaperone activity